MEDVGSKKQPQRLEKPVRITEQVWPEGTEPTVTIVSWVYNHERFLREAIEGFLMQETTFPVEIILHDDASTDCSVDIIREYEREHPKLFRNILRPTNMWQRGINVAPEVYRIARGEFVALCEGDDFWITADKLEKQLAVLRANPNASGTFHAVSMVNEAGKTLEIRPTQPVPTHLKFRDIVVRNPLLTCSLVFRSSAIPVASDWSAGLPMGDWPLQVNLTRAGDLLGIDQNMGCYRRHHGGAWTRMSKSEELKAIGDFYSAVCKAFKGCLPKEFYRRCADHYWECFEVSLNEQGFLRAGRHWVFYLCSRLKYCVIGHS